ncbi:MAG: CAP domain-containing protein [Calditrichaeota bacterium]|nr:MAG: CAP domain-containing protein [Calditrichota bacterium]
MFKYITAGFFITALVLAAVGFWQPEYYQQYTLEDFEKSALANRQIDMDQIDYSLLHAAVFYQTNRIRLQYRLEPFIYSRRLEHAAKSHSDDMVRLNFFSHVSPISEKRNLTDRLQLAGLTRCRMAENIAETSGLDAELGRPMFTPEQNGGYFSYTYQGTPLPNHSYLSLAQAVVNQWIMSEGHRNNILVPKLKYLGVGAAQFKDQAFHTIDRCRFTQNFSDKDGEPAPLNQ